MILIPAIDLRGGRVVRLEQGDYQREHRYTIDPLALAERYATAGAQLIHVVDLDSARSGGDANLEVIAELCRSVEVPIQTGGGVRSREDLERRLEAGAERVVIGSLCVTETATVGEWLEELGANRIVAGLDVTHGMDGGWMPRVAGWTREGREDLFTLLDRLMNHGLKHLLCTDIDRDGMFSGPSLGLYREICDRKPSLRVQASGGVGSAADLKSVSTTRVAGCIVGRALLENRVSVTEIARWSR
jgi:phosphoribosylformimino-5-aminoimidazole carboxamide ribotide isomerase